MCPEKQMESGEKTKEAVKEELTSALGPRGMSVEQMMGKPEIKSIMKDAKDAGAAKAQVRAFLEKKGIIRSKSAPPPKESKKEGPKKSQ